LFLKALTLRGFKTFADKTTVEFNPSGGIIAVVGPNGCGKSNIVDAIRWVLGEQSLREIRSSALEDIIFAGTMGRKPLSLAEASLSIDNSDKTLQSDYTEIDIKRRIYRSGESEFFINKTPCRLKDIRDLFMDTGLGKGAYSIINQGQVDAILSSKPEERRAPFEEAAQISKYRFRKEAAGRKLIATEQNLLRVNDIKQELSSQVKILEEQAAKARRFKELKAGLKDLEIGLCKKQLQSLNERKLSMTGRIEKLRADLNASQDRFGKVEEERHQTKEDLKRKEEEIEAAISGIEEKTRGLEEAKRNLEIERERERSLAEQLKAAEKEAVELKAQLADYETKLGERKKQRDKDRSQWESKENELAEIKERVAALESENDTLQKAQEDFRSSILEIERDLSEARNKVIELDGSARFANEELARDRRTIAKLEKEAGELKTKQTKQSEEAEEKERAIVELDRAIEEKSQRRKKLEASLQRSEETLLSKKEDLSSKTSKLSLLKEIFEEHEGFSEGARETIKLSKREPKKYKIIGVVADLIKSDEKYELALEAALGSSIQVIITGTDKTAKELIEHLRRENLGRASFLPLNLLRGGEGQSADLFKNHQGFIGIAKDLVNVEGEARKAVDFLLGRTALFDSLENALKAFKQEKITGGMRIATLTGELITQNGMISGGTPRRKTAAHLGREREIISLTSDLDEIKSRINDLQSEINATKNELGETEAAVNKLSGEKNNEQLSLAKIKQEEESIVALIKNAEEEQGLLSEGLEARKNEIEDISKSKASLSESIRNMEVEKSSIEGELGESSQKINLLSTSREETNRKLTESRIETSQLSHSLRSSEEEIEILEQNSSRINETFRVRAELDLDGKHAFSKEEIARLEANLPALSEERKELEQGLKDKKLEKAKLADTIEEIEKIMSGAGGEERVLRDKLAKEEVVGAKVEAEMNLISQAISEEYGITVDEILAFGFDVPNQSKAKDEIRSLKDSIKALGDVNLLAIEEFEKTKERLSFLTEQTADLTEARENLKMLITHLDQKARESFLETIRVVSENFSKIFANLFDGGEAKIMLIEGEDILDAGIEIVAKPHGKKWLSLELLSGGERALTAIAILFALLKTHPSPFCFLDEVDAALDDANIGRFVKMLKSFAEEIQMAVITHSKRTMAAADILYGVTMEEPGISKLVSMRLAEVS
jgi:chromosome segregation protein